MSNASRSRTAFWYSVRLRRCSGSVRPGLGCAAATRSISVSSQAANPSLAAASGRGLPAGGIEPVRSFLITFSQTSALPGTSARSAVRSAIGTVPRAASRSLWHVRQYRSSSASCAATGDGDAASDSCRGPAAATGASQTAHATIQTPNSTDPRRIIGPSCRVGPASRRSSLNKCPQPADPTSSTSVVNRQSDRQTRRAGTCGAGLQVIDARAVRLR